MRFIGKMCLHKECGGVCLHKGHWYVDVTTFSMPFGLLLCMMCSGYRLEALECEW